VFATSVTVQLWRFKRDAVTTTYCCASGLNPKLNGDLLVHG